MKNKIIVTQGKYILSTVHAEDCSDSLKELKEIAFLGRSNVGKSSLINSLARIKGLAKVSSSPGKTQTINFFEITLKEDNERNSFYLVDLPGYGYAKTGKENRKKWAKFIEDYLLSSKKLLFLCLALDLRHDPQKNDIDMFKFLVKNNVPVLIIGTKADKLSKNAVVKSAENIKKTLGIKELSVLPYSSVTHTGRSELLEVINNSLKGVS